MISALQKEIRRAHSENAVLLAYEMAITSDAMENYLWQVADIRNSGKVHLPLTGSTWIPMVTARDVALVAARRLLDEGEVEELLASGRTVMLTDRYAPVDQMLAPVFRGEVPER